ncbi:MAG: hypothetical protein ABIV13_05270 [Fimbriimonadales bacterium]
MFGLTAAFILGVTGLAMISPWAAGAAFPLGVGSLIVWSYLRKKKAEGVSGFVRGETAAWYSQLHRFNRERQLESRSHPELIPELKHVLSFALRCYVSWKAQTGNDLASRKAGATSRVCVEK